jgi:hypothetical protein
MITETEDDIIITDTECKSFSDYAVFHLQNIGYQWIERATGNVFDKGIMFSKFHRQKEILKSLTKNCQIHFDRIKKKDYLCGDECSVKLKQLLKSADFY